MAVKENSLKWVKIIIPYKCLLFSHEKNEYLFDSLSQNTKENKKSYGFT